MTYSVPSLCRVRVRVTPASDSDINLEVWLPETWNGRYYQHGEGGGGGRINYEALAKLVEGGAAAAATDDGFSLYALKTDNLARASRHLVLYQDHPEKFVDNSYRALAETSANANALIRRYYGRAPEHRYFEGCSGGGSYALRAAQRFPEDWDGILVGAPANNTTRYFVSAAWNARWAWLDPKARISPDKLPMIQRAAVAACPPSAHVQDGVAADPRLCRFDPQVLACRGEETSDCLTAPQIEALKHIYAGPRNPRTGEKLYPGFPPTGETTWPGWVTAVPTAPDSAPYTFSSANSFYRFIFNTAEWDVSRFDFDAGVALSEGKLVSGEPLRLVLNATDPDLSGLRRHGGKVLMYFGWNDPVVTPLEGISYYESVARKMGGINAVQEFFRLFLVPGMGHCGAGGAGANAFGQWPAPALRDDASHNIMRALEAWVEAGRQPDELIAARYIDNDPKKGVAFTRRLCRYPQVPVYTGRGSVAEAASFECKNPDSS